MAPAESISAARPVGEDRWMALRGEADQSERPVEEGLAVAAVAGMLCAWVGECAEAGQRGWSSSEGDARQEWAQSLKVARSVDTAVLHDWVPLGGMWCSEGASGPQYVGRGGRSFGRLV